MAVESYEIQGIESVEPEAGGAATRLAAPGQGVVAARAFGTPAESPVGDQYAAASGSSAAAANVSGVCALLLEAVPEATPAQLTASLLRASRALAEGRGALNALSALADLRERIRRPESSTRSS